LREEFGMIEPDIRMHAFGKTGKACLICGCAEPNRLSRHSVAGLSVTLCQPCCQDLRDRSIPPLAAIWEPPDNLESIAQALLAEADLLSLLAQSRWVIAHALLDRVRREGPFDSNETP
jgi:hypothetical protein